MSARPTAACWGVTARARTTASITCAAGTSTRGCGSGWPSRHLQKRTLTNGCWPPACPSFVCSSSAWGYTPCTALPTTYAITLNTAATTTTSAASCTRRARKPSATHRGFARRFGDTVSPSTRAAADAAQSRRPPWMDEFFGRATLLRAGGQLLTPPGPLPRCLHCGGRPVPVPLWCWRRFLLPRLGPAPGHT